MADHEFQLNDRIYRLRRMGAMDANHVARKLATTLVWLASRKSAPVTETEPAPTREVLAQALCAASGYLSKADEDFVTGLCLSTVTRQASGGAGWTPLMAGGGQLMDASLGIMDLNLILLEVLEANKIIDFFVVRPSASSALLTTD